MPPGVQIVTFRPGEQLLRAMEDLREREGVPYSEQIRRALRVWFETRGVSVKKAERKRAATRKRP